MYALSRISTLIRGRDLTAIFSMYVIKQITVAKDFYGCSSPSRFMAVLHLHVSEKKSFAEVSIFGFE